MTRFATSDVSDLIGFSPNQLRHYARRGLLEPERGTRGEYQFSFQDIVLLRAIKRLLSDQVSPRRALRILLKLKQDPEHFESLSAIKLFVEGREVVAQQAQALWDAESGQGVFDFSAASPARVVARMVDGNVPADGDIIIGELDSDDWYNLGLDLEEGDPARAIEAYRHALQLDPGNIDAYVNLGRLYQLGANIRSAKRCYEIALRQAPDHQLALYNLGTLFDELDELDMAIEQYRRALLVPDAHYNLARIHEMRGDELSARRHLRSYHELLERR